MTRFRSPLASRRQRGAYAVEFALVAAVLFTALLAVFEFGRIMLVWNQAVEATTQGARLAAVCPIGSSAPARRMDQLLPGVADAVLIEYKGWTLGAGSGTTSSEYTCDGTAAKPCLLVRAKLISGEFRQRFSTPLLSQLVNVPEFTTSIPSESVYVNAITPVTDPNPQCSL